MTALSFGHRTTVGVSTSTYLPGTGGTNQAAEITLVIPQDGTLKDLAWDCQSNGLTGIGNKFTIKVGAVHATPTSAAPALTDALVVSIDGKTNGSLAFNYPVVAGQRVGVLVQTVAGGTSISRIRVSFELDESTTNPWQVAGSDVYFDLGNVGIGTTTPGEMLTVNGVIESAVGGFRFPDGSVQATAGQADLTTRVQALMNADLPSMCTHYAQAFIMQDGTVKTSGHARYGDLGSGNYENHHMRPVPLAFNNQSIGPVSSVILNFHGAHALTAAGDVWGWGYNNVGQIGDGSYTTRYYPVPLYWGAYTKPKIVKLACSTREEYHNNHHDYSSWYALDDAGRVWAWGYNGYGQLAINNTVSQPQPFLTDITNVVDIEASGGLVGVVFAVKSDGTVWSAGYNGSGIGILGYAGSSQIWKQVNLPAPCTKVRSTGHWHTDGNSYGHTLFLLADGRVFSSGYNGYGQLGNGTNNNVNGDPTLITPLSNIVDIWVGGGLWGYSFAAKANGDFVAWGLNNYGQLGIGIGASGGPENKNGPVPHPIKNVKSVKIGGWGNNNHSLLLTQSGQVYSAGCNDHGQLGMGVSGQPVPPYTHNLMLLPPGIQGNIMQIGVSGHSNVAASQMLDNNGNVWTCGNNTAHQLSANPSFGDRHTMPTRVMF